jgi:hypothetical protein
MKVWSSTIMSRIEATVFDLVGWFAEALRLDAVRGRLASREEVVEWRLESVIFFIGVLWYQ